MQDVLDQRPNACAQSAHEEEEEAAADRGALEDVFGLRHRELDAYVTAEIARKIATSTWRKLDVCFKWQKVREYVASAPCAVAFDDEDDPRLAHIKQLLVRGELTKCVEYDPESLCIVSLNSPDEVCAMVDAAHAGHD